MPETVNPVIVVVASVEVPVTCKAVKVGEVEAVRVAKVVLVATVISPLAETTLYEARPPLAEIQEVKPAPSVLKTCPLVPFVGGSVKVKLLA
jgi:hypothetical protein